MVNTDLHCYSPRFSKASCAGVVRAAKGFVEDVGVQSASKSVGLVELASRLEKNAERDCHRLMANRLELSLPIPQSTLKVEDSEGRDLHLPVLRLRDWAQYLVDGNHTHILTGLTTPDWKRESDILTAFWANYEIQEPTHPVFEMARRGELELCKCFPMVAHGDEGRGRKRTGFLVLNFHSVLGRGVMVNKKKKRKKLTDTWACMSPNYHGHTLTSRFLLAAMPKYLYTGNNEHIFGEVMDLAAQEAQNMLSTGTIDGTHGRGKFTMATLHICGDWPWLADSGYLLRSFRNVQKHKTRKKAPVGVCHQCQAGQLGVDFEQINTARPTWLRTMFSQDLCDANWKSPLLEIPHPPGKTALLWQWDIFHTWHLGVSRCFLGSFLAILSELQPETSIDDRFNSMSALYLDFCRLKHRRAHITKITKELIGWSTTTTYPTGGWHKGDLSTSLMSWVAWRYEREGHGWSPMLKLAGQAAIEGNDFLKTLFDGEAWLTPREAKKAAGLSLGFLRKYSKLARMAWRDSVTLWVLMPKFHSLHHLSITLLHGSEKGKVLNPLCYGAQADEDFIGRPSRLARRVTANPVMCCSRVIQRYLEASYAEWIKAGYLIRPHCGTPR